VDVVSWLLEGEPAVRLAVRTRLLGDDPGSPECLDLRSRAMVEGTIPAILATQAADGHWGAPDRFYTAKYTGTVWNLIILAELGADGEDERVRRAAEAVLRDSRHPVSGGFSTGSSKREGGGLPSMVIPCLTGNVVFALVRLGLLSDTRVARAVDWITTYQRFDDAEGDAPTGWPYDHLEMCWGRHTCSMGVVKALKGLAAIPDEDRSGSVRATLAEGAEWLLKHHVHKRSHDLARLSKPGWKKFGFPRMYQTDVLEILLLLTRLGYADPRMDEAFALVESKRDTSGRWRLDDTFNDRFCVPIESAGEPSRWVTLAALEVLARRSALAPAKEQTTDGDRASARTTEDQMEPKPTGRVFS
jgi:hypothetical protein